MNKADKVDVYAVIVDDGDGSATIHFHLNKEKAESLCDVFDEDYIVLSDYPEEIQTYVGSNIHKEALEFEGEDDE